MVIRFERSGGFAGIRLTATVDTEALPAKAADRVQKLIAEAGFYQLPANVGTSAGAADRFEYTVMVEAAGKQHVVTICEAAAEPELRRLLEWLTQAATSKGR